MIALLEQLLKLDFMRNALLVGILISVPAAFLGVPLVLRRYSTIGDGLGHIGFAAITVAAALNLAPLHVALPVMIAASFLLIVLNNRSKIPGDAAIALASTGALTVGVLVSSMHSGLNTDLNGYLFGSLLAMPDDYVRLSILLAVISIVISLLTFHRIFAVTFDERFARATGVGATLINAILATLTAVTITVGMKIMGTLLISSLMIFPSLTAMRVTGSYKGTVAAAACISVCCVIIGVLASFGLGIPTGAAIVAANIAAFLLFSAWGLLRRDRSWH